MTTTFLTKVKTSLLYKSFFHLAARTYVVVARLTKDDRDYSFSPRPSLCTNTHNIYIFHCTDKISSAGNNIHNSYS